MSVISGVMGSQAQESAAKKSGQAATESAAISAETQKYMFDQMMKLQQPYNQLGMQGLGQMGGVDPTGGSGQYLGQMEAMPGLELPTLNMPEFNYAFDENDPGYQFRQKEMEKTINQAAAARGNWNSRPVINALSEGNLALTADETTRQFGRAKDIYGMEAQGALSQYSADYEKASDLYGTGYNKLSDLFSKSLNLGTLDYNKIIDAIKIGQGAAGTAGQGAMATGQGLASTQNQLGNILSNTALMSGQAQSDMYSGIGGSSVDAYMLYKLFEKG